MGVFTTVFLVLCAVQAYLRCYFAYAATSLFAACRRILYFPSARYFLMTEKNHLNIRPR